MVQKLCKYGTKHKCLPIGLAVVCYFSSFSLSLTSRGRHASLFTSSVLNFLLAFLVILAILPSRLSFVSGLEVTASSKCVDVCIDSRSFNGTNLLAFSTSTERDVGLLASDYDGENSTEQGRKFKSCISFRPDSTEVGPAIQDGPETEEENDLYWYCVSIYYSTFHGSLSTTPLEKYTKAK